jgi:hypothetical protein
MVASYKKPAGSSTAISLEFRKMEAKERLKKDNVRDEKG